jgi:predicted nucleotidyltransferase
MTESSLHITGISRQKTVPGSVAGRKEIIQTLTYFDIFHYPLTFEEIRQFLGIRVDENLLQQWLHQLQADKKVFFYTGFYSIQNNPLLVHRRKQGNQLAEKILPKALKIGRFLYQFPFVRSVGISGSLSKNYADEKSDIDFFIITKANRLWVARTIMHLYKKLTFLTGKQHLHCMNYYVDEKALLLEDQNIFTAIEIRTLLPVCGKEAMTVFFATNTWAGELLPACDHRVQQGNDPGPSWLKRITESILQGGLWNRLDNYLLRITRTRWKHKEEKGKRNKKGQSMGLITGKHFARSNPGAFQEKVLALYEQKLSGLKQPVYHDEFIASSAT